MSRVELAQVSALTFYKGALTAARRTDPWPQLKCIGAACKLYQPEVVRCVNLGGSGTDIDWKCEADLPESLRFGKVEVNCEGWSRPGDKYVLKGSCALEYRLVQIPDALRNGRTDSSMKESLESIDWSTTFFWILWFAVLAFIAYRFFSSLWSDNRNARPQTTRGPRPPPGGPGGGNNHGWFPGDHPPDYYGAPPPYSKDPPQAGEAPGWRPGFWTGAALGGLANHLWNRNQQRPREPIMRPAEYGWERTWNPFSTQPVRRPTFQRPRHFDDNDRGEGPSNLGSMRSSTGFGGSNVR